MWDAIWKTFDYGPKIWGLFKILVDLKYFIISVILFLLIQIAANFAYFERSILNFLFPIYYPLDPTSDISFQWFPFGGVGFLILCLFFMSIVINRKLWIYITNKKIFLQFYQSLDTNIKTNQDFRNKWNLYQILCKRLDKNHRYIDEDIHTDGISLIYRQMSVTYSRKAKSKRRNTNTDEWTTDVEYQRRVLLYNFIQKICNFVISYDPERHLQIKDEQIVNAFNSIQLDEDFIKIIEYCHLDGKGFLTTLALENLIAISMTLPHEKRVVLLQILRKINTNNLGWLNRRIFEVLLVNVALRDLSDSEWESLIIDVNRANETIASITIRYVFDETVEKYKNAFRETVLKKYLNEGLKYDSEDIC